jgi:tetratricopeptide (TPR) repeat protein
VRSFAKFRRATLVVAALPLAALALFALALAALALTALALTALSGCSPRAAEWPPVLYDDGIIASEPTLADAIRWVRLTREMGGDTRQVCERLAEASQRALPNIGEPSIDEPTLDVVVWLRECGKHAEAANALDELRDRDEDAARLLMAADLMATALDQGPEASRVIVALQKVIEDSKFRNVRAFVLLGAFQLRQRRTIGETSQDPAVDEGRKNLLRAIVVGDPPAASAILADDYRHRGQLRLAAHVAQHALKRHPDDGSLHRALAAIRYQQGQRAEAERLLRNAPPLRAVVSAEPPVIEPIQAPPCSVASNDPSSARCRAIAQMHAAASVEELDDRTREALALWQDEGATACRDEAGQCEPWAELAIEIAASYARLGKSGHAIRVRQVLLRPEFRLHEGPLAASVMASLAEAYLKLGIFDRAATWHERYALAYLGSKTASPDPRAMLATAIDLRDALGQAEQAAALRDKARALHERDPSAALDRVLEPPARSFHAPQALPAAYALPSPVELVFPGHVR